MNAFCYYHPYKWNCYLPHFWLTLVYRISSASVLLLLLLFTVHLFGSKIQIQLLFIGSTIPSYTVTLHFVYCEKDGENEKNIRGESNWCVYLAANSVFIHVAKLVPRSLNYFHFTTHTLIWFLFLFKIFILF